MASVNEPLPWEFDADHPYVPLFCEGECVGYCDPDFARDIADAMNEQEKLQKALRLACQDLARQLKGEAQQVEELVEKYVRRAERPKSGPRALALLLADRQKQLGVNPQEFIKFCDSYRLSPKDIKAMCAGKPVAPRQVPQIARILGISVDDVYDVLNG